MNKYSVEIKVEDIWYSQLPFVSLLLIPNRQQEN